MADNITKAAPKGKVKFNITLSDEQKDQLRQFDVMLETDNKNHRPKASTWFDTVKDFFK